MPLGRSAEPYSYGFLQLRDDADGRQDRVLRSGSLRENHESSRDLRAHGAHVSRGDGLSGDGNRPDAVLRPAAAGRRCHRGIQDPPPAVHRTRTGFLQHDAEARPQGRGRNRVRGRLPAAHGSERRESSQPPRNLAEIGISLDATPHVFQYNKRDLANILTLDELNDALNPDGAVEWYEASARNRTGVFETLKAISKLTLRSLKGRMAVEQRRPAVVATATTPGPQPMMSSKAAASGIGEAIDAMATTQAVITAPAVPEEGSDSTISRLKRFQEAARRQNRDLEARDVPADTSPALLLSAETAPFDAANYPQTEDTASEVSFAEIQPPPDDVPMDSSMKHVRVRSNVDILSELEKLRKIATQRPAMPGGSHKSKSAADFSLDDLLGSARNHRKDVAQSFDLEVPRDTLAKTRHVTVGLSFGDGAGAALGSEKRFDVDFAGLKDINKLLLSLKFHVKGE